MEVGQKDYPRPHHPPPMTQPSTPAAKFLLLLLTICLVPFSLALLLFFGNAVYWQGHAEGEASEASVACAPNDGNLPELLRCYQEKTICEEILAAKSGGKRQVAKNLNEWNGVTGKGDINGIVWPYTCEYFPEEYGC